MGSKATLGTSGGSYSFHHNGNQSHKAECSSSGQLCFNGAVTVSVPGCPLYLERAAIQCHGALYSLREQSVPGCCLSCPGPVAGSIVLPNRTLVAVE